jgi:hypothetical protein
MKPRDIIRQIGDLPREYFTPLEVQKITGRPEKGYIYLLLKRLEESGSIRRLSQGIYVIEGREYSVKNIALDAYKPSYLSFQAALFDAGVLSQGGYTITLATLLRPKQRIIDGLEVRYIKIPERLFWGFDVATMVAEPEKAFIDYCWLSTVQPVDPSLSTWYADSLNQRKLSRMIKKVESEGYAPLAGLAREMFQDLERQEEGQAAAEQRADTRLSG